MTAKEAKGIMSGQKDNVLTRAMANGYLNALSGPEVKVLLEALETIEKIDGPVFNGETVTTLNPYQIDTWQRLAKEALENFRKMVEKCPPTI